MLPFESRVGDDREAGGPGDGAGAGEADVLLVAIPARSRESQRDDPVFAVGEKRPQARAFGQFCYVSANFILYRWTPGPLRVIKDANMVLTTFGLSN